VRLGLAVSLACGLAVCGCGGHKQAQATTAAARRPAAPRFRLTLSAPTHRPRVGPKWWYVIRATGADGRFVRGRLTVEVVDPLGTAHPAEVGTTTRTLVNFPFTGRYRDFAQWPPASRGYPLSFQVTVAADGGRKTVRYSVTPR
jgi:hypothetical protein